MNNPKQEPKGVSPIELLVAVAIILITAAIVIPNLLRAHMTANGSSAVEFIRTNAGATTYNSNSTYPTVGLSTAARTDGLPDENPPC